MILKEMYPGMDNSPDTKLTATIGPTDTVIPVENVGAFPDGPNYAVIGNDNDAELIKYAVKTTNSLSGCTRGFGALPAKAWQSGESIARNITNTDLMNLIDNVLVLDSGKQDELTAGTNVTIDESNVISATDTKYTAGTNVTINGNTINATDTKYGVATISADGLMASADKIKLNGKQDKLTVGANVAINENNVISATDTKYTAGTNVTITGTTISAKDTIYDDTPLKIRITAVEDREDKDTTYTAGTNVKISTSNVISATDTTYEVATTSTDGLMASADKIKLNGKQDKLTAGANVSISDNTISATDTKYTAGANVTIRNNVISASWSSGVTIVSQYDIPKEGGFTGDLRVYLLSNGWKYIYAANLARSVSSRGTVAGILPAEYRPLLQFNTYFTGIHITLSGAYTPAYIYFSNSYIGVYNPNEGGNGILCTGFYL